MTQQTLTGGEIPSMVPFSQLTNNERIIYNFLKTMGRGYTHDQIRDVLKSTKISTFDNRLRALRQKGWVVSHEDRSGLLLWYARDTETQDFRKYAVKPEAEG